ncbi:hypothetical protein MRS44_008017 [Fusarium solani]|uniref:uncharacterized protein n=1 Tax=Fusarium solani TaxID=169388 RepID=UPI0032C49884|nr:hypothetical protein MRS44_008017 [Fusarium solani]
MSSQAAAKAAGGLVSIAKKQTVQSTGVWEVLRRFFAIDPERSNGVPLNPHFRNPPPAPTLLSNSRRNYPQLSVVNQSQFAQLLTVGSAAAPKVELIGEAGEKQLVAVKEESQTGLAQALGKVAPGEATKDVFVNGLPPLPSGQSLSSGAWDVHKYEVTDTSYGEG